MLTSSQLKAARILLGLQPSKLAERLGVPTLLFKFAESAGLEVSFTLARAERVKGYLESRGIEFLPEGSEPPARLKDP